MQLAYAVGQTLSKQTFHPGERRSIGRLAWHPWQAARAAQEPLVVSHAPRVAPRPQAQPAAAQPRPGGRARASARRAPAAPRVSPPCGARAGPARPVIPQAGQGRAPSRHPQRRRAAAGLRRPSAAPRTGGARRRPRRGRRRRPLPGSPAACCAARCAAPARRAAGARLRGPGCLRRLAAPAPGPPWPLPRAQRPGARAPAPQRPAPRPPPRRPRPRQARRRRARRAAPHGRGPDRTARAATSVDGAAARAAAPRCARPPLDRGRYATALPAAGPATGRALRCRRRRSTASAPWRTSRARPQHCSSAPRPPGTHQGQPSITFGPNRAPALSAEAAGHPRVPGLSVRRTWPPAPPQRARQRRPARGIFDCGPARRCAAGSWPARVRTLLSQDCLAAYAASVAAVGRGRAGAPPAAAATASARPSRRRARQAQAPAGGCRSSTPPPRAPRSPRAAGWPAPPAEAAAGPAGAARHAQRLARRARAAPGDPGWPGSAAQPGAPAAATRTPKALLLLRPAAQPPRRCPARGRWRAASQAPGPVLGPAWARWRALAAPVRRSARLLPRPVRVRWLAQAQQLARQAATRS